MRPEISYDPEADAVYVPLSDITPVEASEVAPGVVLDLDADGRVVGIELQSARTTLAPGAWSKAGPPQPKRSHAAE